MLGTDVAYNWRRDFRGCIYMYCATCFNSTSNVSGSAVEARQNVCLIILCDNLCIDVTWSDKGAGHSDWSADQHFWAIITFIIIYYIIASCQVMRHYITLYYVANLAPSSYFHLRRLRAIRRLRLLSCLHLYCPCLRLLSNRLLQCSSGWSSKG